MGKRKPPLPTFLHPVHIKALKRAIDGADQWRGALMGHPDQAEVLREHDVWIDIAKEAVAIATNLNKPARAAHKAAYYKERAAA